MTTTLSPATPNTPGAAAMFSITTTYLDEPVEVNVTDQADIVRFVGTLVTYEDRSEIEIYVYDGATSNEILTLKNAAEQLRDGTFDDPRFVYEGGYYHLDVPTTRRDLAVARGELAEAAAA